MNKTKCWFFEKMKCIDNPLASLTQKKERKDSNKQDCE